MDTSLTRIPVSAGELADKITILQIKKERITDSEKLASVNAEFELLSAELARLPQSVELSRLSAELKSANEKIWDAEEALRADGIEDEDFLSQSKISHSGNDERFRLKSEINKLLGSEIVEVKSHQD